jgi:hypothetical protein
MMSSSSRLLAAASILILIKASIIHIVEFKPLSSDGSVHVNAGCHKCLSKRFDILTNNLRVECIPVAWQRYKKIGLFLAELDLVHVPTPKSHLGGTSLIHEFGVAEDSARDRD